jgi:hypothetical protein
VFIADSRIFGLEFFPRDAEYQRIVELPASINHPAQSPFKGKAELLVQTS